MNILWIEDGNRESIKEAIFPMELLGKYHCRIDESFNNFGECFDAVKRAEKDYDLIILDINLEEFGPCEKAKETAAKLKIETGQFLKTAGLDLYLTLLQQGFNKQKIVFLTGNTSPNHIASLRRRLEHAINNNDEKVIEEYLEQINVLISEEERESIQAILNSKLSRSEKFQNLIEEIKFIEELQTENNNNSYEQFRENFRKIHLDAPEAYHKGNREDFEIWFEDRLNPKSAEYRYSALRRGILHAADFLQQQLHKSDNLKEYLLFNKTVKKDEDAFDLTQEKQYFLEYLKKLGDFFSLNPPQNRNALYYRFIREMASEWDRSLGYFNRDFKNKLRENEEDLTYNFLDFAQRQMKLLRNLSAHFKIDENQLNEKTLAYFFMIAMRAIFKLDINTVFAYEEYFANLYNIPENGFILDDANRNKIARSYQKLRAEFRYDNPSGNSFTELLMAFTRPDDDKTQKNIQKKSLKLLYQNYYHGIFPARMNVASTKNKDNVAMFVNFDFRKLPKKSFLKYLAGLIYNEAF